MPRYELITKSGFAAQAWRRYDSYAFAATDAVAENGSAKVSHGSGVIISLRAT